MRTSKSRNKHVAKISCNKVNFLGDACMRNWLLVFFLLSYLPYLFVSVVKMKEYMPHLYDHCCLNKGVSVRVARLFVLFWLLTQGLGGVSRDPWTDR